jgi:hypothetical protein
MGALLELTVFTHQLIAFERIEHAFHKYGLSLTIKDIYSIDNWSWENERHYPALLDIAELSDMIASGKVLYIRFDGTYQGVSWPCICIFYKDEDDAFATEVAFDMRECEPRFVDHWTILMAENQELYNSIIREVSDLSQQSTLIAAGLGKETVCLYKGDIIRTILDSLGVGLWIIPNDQVLSDQVASELGYHRQKYDEFVDLFLWRSRESMLHAEN